MDDEPEFKRLPMETLRKIASRELNIPEEDMIMEDHGDISFTDKSDPSNSVLIDEYDGHVLPAPY